MQRCTWKKNVIKTTQLHLICNGLRKNKSRRKKLLLISCRITRYDLLCGFAVIIIFIYVYINTSYAENIFYM